MLLLHRITNPNRHPASAAECCPDLLAVWLRYAPQSQPEDCDFEDWAEPAAILAALEKHGTPQILPAVRRGLFSGDNTPLVKATPGAEDAVMWGMFHPSDSIDFPVACNLLWNSEKQVRAVQNYALSPVFRAHAGRAFHVCDVTDESVSAAIVALREAGHTKGFVKTRDKGEANLFNILQSIDSGLNYSLDLQDPYLFVTREGDKNALFIQEAIRPTREYRMIVVGDTVVTGAGCIEAFTPCDNTGDAFDCRMEVVRNQGEIVEDVITLRRYQSFAYAYAKAWAREHGNDMAYSLDLCVNADTGKVQIIEMNPCCNLGLYANRPDLLIGAMIKQAPARRIAALAS